MKPIAKFFRLQENGTTVTTEFFAGLTTFVTMVYILAVNPMILGEAHPDRAGLFTATALMIVLGSLLMAFWAKYPFALAPGMGLNAFFVYGVVAQVGNWHTGLLLLLVQGLLFMLLALGRFRERLFDIIPKNMKLAFGVGIGLFITHIGLQNAGFVVADPYTLVKMGDVGQVPVVLFLVGCLISGLLVARNVRGGLFWGILATYGLGLAAQLTGFYEPAVSLIPEGVVALPPSLAEVNLLTNFDQVTFADVSWYVVVSLILVLLVVEALDTVGTLIGVTEKADFLQKDDLKRKGRALFSDAVTTAAGGAMGTSTTTIYIESAAGIQAGGKTGLTALVVGALFLVSMFFWPIFAVIPAFATAPALVLVGLYMTGLVRKIDFDGDFTEAFPAFLVMVMMPLTFSVSDGVVFGIIAYVLLKLCTGKGRQVPVLMYGLAVLFGAMLVMRMV